MHRDEFIATYPQLFHMAELDAWPLLQRIGLLSVAELLEAFGVEREERERILRTRRSKSIVLSDPEIGSVTLRDQGAISDSKLEAVLEGGMTTSDWYATLNERAYFWPTQKRVQVLLNAKRYRDRSHLILVVDTASLLERHEAQVELSPINSGATLFDAVARGPATFASIGSYDFETSRKRRGRARAIAEVTVLGGVRDLASLRVARYEAKEEDWRLI